MPAPLSVIVCTRNEEHRIGRLVEHVGFADEILVLDCGSTDRTVEIARAAGARVEHQDWLGFSAQKNAAAKLARHDWVLSLDADEIVTPELAAAIEAALAADPDPRDGFVVDRRGDFMGKVLPNTMKGTKRRGYVRMYHRAHSGWDEDMALHEVVRVPGAARMLDGLLLHWNDLSMDDFLVMFNRYATAEANDMYRAGERVRAIEVIVRPLMRFLWVWGVKGEWRLGGHGLVHSGLRAVHDYMRFSKLWELQHGTGETVDPAHAWGRG